MCKVYIIDGVSDIEDFIKGKIKTKEVSGNMGLNIYHIYRFI